MICHYSTNILLLFDLDIKKLQRKEKNTNFTLSPSYILIKVKPNKEKKKMATPRLMDPAIFSFDCTCLTSRSYQNSV